MDFRLQPLAFSLAIAWIEIGSELPIEILDDDGKNLGVKNVRFIAKDHCIIDNRDYIMFPKVDETGKFILDEKGKIIIFIMITSSKRTSSIWP